VSFKYLVLTTQPCTSLARPTKRGETVPWKVYLASWQPFLLGSCADNTSYHLSLTLACMGIDETNYDWSFLQPLRSNNVSDAKMTKDSGMCSFGCCCLELVAMRASS
jgi:hypothetical protein